MRLVRFFLLLFFVRAAGLRSRAPGVCGFHFGMSVCVVLFFPRCVPLIGVRESRAGLFYRGPVRVEWDVTSARARRYAGMCPMTR